MSLTIIIWAFNLRHHFLNNHEVSLNKGTQTMFQYLHGKLILNLHRVNWSMWYGIKAYGKDVKRLASIRVTLFCKFYVASLLLVLMQNICLLFFCFERFIMILSRFQKSSFVNIDLFIQHQPVLDVIWILVILSQYNGVYWQDL